MDLWGRKLGIPYREFSVMPIGEVHDLMSAYQVINGTAVEVKRDLYIPCLR